ncbi:MAG: TonB family protein, partial [Gammaproteobacteria bacterium]|nr:TonB family protein [Gammaproteobacteria bacterium]
QEARAARLQTQREQYVLDIAKKVEDNWLRPVSTTSGQSCEVIVRQTMTGDVIDVRVQSCASDNAFQRSVERAVRKASPLPLPPDPELFDREIYFKFKPRV